MGIQVKSAYHAHRALIQIAVTLGLAVLHPTDGLADDKSRSGTGIDLTQVQTRTIDPNAATVADKYGSLRIGAAGDASQVFEAASRADTGFVAAQSGTADLIQLAQNGRDARLRAAQSGSSNRLTSVQGDLGMLLVTQRGDHNEMQVLQSGRNNTSTLDQAGSYNSITGQQSGASNSASISQAGMHQVVVYVQSGTGSSLTVRQH